MKKNANHNRPNLLNRGLFFARRLSVIYLFLILVGISFSFYYLKYLPANEQELKGRGLRILNQLSAIMVSRNQDLNDFFSSQTIEDSLKNHKGYFAKVFAKLSYETADVDNEDTLRHKGPLEPYITSDGQNGWNILYPASGKKKRRNLVEIDFSDYMGPVIESRDDLFDNYLVLKSSDSDSGNFRHPSLSVIYLENALTEGGMMNTDTLFKSQKNSDLAGVEDLMVSGVAYKTFFRPLLLNRQHIILAGMIRTDRYTRMVREVPASFISTLLIAIILVFVCLPFIKLFLISPKEKLGKLDVIGCTLSIFAGSTAVFLVFFYLFLQMVTTQTFERRLGNIGEKLTADIHSDIACAGAQLDSFNRVYQDSIAGKKISMGLAPESSEQEGQELEKSRLLMPSACPAASKVFWIDSSGTTLARWSFRQNEIPVSWETNPFFKLLKSQNPVSGQSRDQIIFYPAFIPITEDYQVYVGKATPIHVNYPVAVKTGRKKPPRKKMESAFTAMCLFLNSSASPVLPPGFGFCLTDSLGNVLVHSDSRRNLRENLFAETDYNQRLSNCFQLDNTSPIENVELYGTMQTLQVFPLRGQPLRLVVFFDQELLVPNQVRLFHFVIEALLYLCIIQVICILIPTWLGNKKNKLRFDIHSIEWIKPDLHNANSYYFTHRYFTALLAIAGSLFIIVFAGWADLRALFYISLLLPSYALLAFIGSRRKELQKRKDYFSQPVHHRVIAVSPSQTAPPADGPPPALSAPPVDRAKPVLSAPAAVASPPESIVEKIFRKISGEIYYFSPTTISVILLVNFVIFHLISTSENSLLSENAKAVLLFQALALIMLYIVNKRFIQKVNIIYPFQEFPHHQAKRRCYYQKKKGINEKKAFRHFRYSVYFGVLLISMIPAAAIVLYGFQSEKIQFKKTKELGITSSFYTREDFLNNTWIPGYKKEFAEWAQSQEFFSGLIEKRGIFLSDNDSIWNNTHLDLRKSNPGDIIDEPYARLMDDWFLVTAQDFENYSVKDSSADNSWKFAVIKSKPDGLVFTDTRNLPASDSGASTAQVWSSLRNPIRNLWGLKPFLRLFCVIVPLLILYVFFRILKESMNRLFLHDFFSGTIGLYVSTDYCRMIYHATGLGVQLPYRTLAKYSNIQLLRFEKEYSNPAGISQDEYVLAMSLYFERVYREIWHSLPDKEKYMLYDLSTDGYINYKNSATIFRLLQKGLIRYVDKKMVIFSYSFRQFLQAKKDSLEINRLISKESEAGAWDTFRIPVLSVLAVGAIFLIVTQNDISHQMTAIVTSAGALIPLVLKIFQPGGQGSSS